MKVAIHNRSGSFSDRWLEYCQQNNIPYKLVNCYASDIISQLADCDALMWHHHHADYKDVLLAKHLLFSIEQSGKKVFPDFNTCWHFDDKLGQKYLLESIAAPLVPSYVFFTKKEAMEWANSNSFPKVFKLRGGAGSANVKLVKNRSVSVKLIKKAFGKGFPQFDRWEYLKEQIRKIKIRKESFMMGMLKGFGRLLLSTHYARMKGNEKGYAYFQDFVPNNSDTRIIVIGDKAFAIKRMTRENDFRASGSGLIRYEKDEIDTRCINIAFEISDKLKLQCMAYDFVFDTKNKPLIVEISYGFAPEGYVACPGYWHNNLTYYAGKFNPYGWMVDQVISDINYSNKS
jgi:glutathione synthase/RimK-type ligase-like ATP-grasp enzyme